jgi:subtilisin family serine protease
MAYVGPQPLRRPSVKGRRPVVATLDTGCGEHPWLDGVVRTDVKLGSQPIGYVDDETDPEKWFDQFGALDGAIDPLAGHGTFIAGLIHQACPDADIVAWRIVGADGLVVESNLVKALEDIAELARRHRDGEPGGHPIDVLSLSLGYYHETPDDELFDPTMYGILRRLGECGVAVVCSAGNDATARPVFPAAFTPWLDDAGSVHAEHGVVPIVSVGALNPNRTTDALFSNTGTWVRTYARGAAVMSTIPPTFQGGFNASASTEAYRRRRASIDPDDYSSGFALWSGTSFSTPFFAGLLAGRLVDTIDPSDDGRAAAVDRAWAAVTASTNMKRPT